ncbi:MAG: 1-acyl-sn-glycerol-3-phosphate acyltransferase [Gemmatimonadaceae bacterium]|nr:1-acyl-sn-glycerol-3-phosphate acyltransferase [Gemmatimonadaceae bacterium]
MLYEALKPVIGIALHWYYRSLSIANLERIPREGPVFLAANHPNSLTDAMVVGWTSPRRVRFTAKATLFANPLSAGFLRAVGVVPLRRSADEKSSTPDGAPAPTVPDAARNAASFAAVADALAEQSCIVVFPEGKTHDEPYMAPVRTGLARMALMARDERGVQGIRIVPIGLLFERKAEPRTRILLQVGEPIDVDGLGSGPSTVATLTELIEQRLRAMTLNFESRADAERIQLLSETLVALMEPETSVDEGAPPLARTLALVRRIERAQQTLRARNDASTSARIDLFEQRLRAWRERLANARIDVHDVSIDLSTSLGARFVVREMAIATVMVPISLWGRVTHIVPIRLARYLALRNVTALDEPPMRTFIVGLVLVLASYVVLTTLVGLAFGPWWALAFFASLIPSASSDLRYGDRMRRVRARARAFRLFRKDPSLQASLLADADWLRVEAGALESIK